MNRPDDPQTGESARRDMGACQRRWRLVVMLGVAAVIGACSHNPIHDESRDKTGQDLKKQVAEARIAGKVAALEKSFRDVAAQEEASVRERVTKRFDEGLRIMSQAPALTQTMAMSPALNGFQTIVEDRLKKIGIGQLSGDQMREFRGWTVKLTAARDSFEVDRTAIEGISGVRYESCQQVFGAARRTDAAGNPPAATGVPSDEVLRALPARVNREVFSLKFDDVYQTCRRIETLVKSEQSPGGLSGIAGAAGGLYLRRSDERGRLLASLDKLDKDTASAKAELAAAVAAHARVVGDPAATGKSREESVAALAKKLGEIVDKFGDAGVHVVSADQLKRLDAILARVAGESEDKEIRLDPGELASVAVVRAIPALADEADKLLRNAAKPRLVPFVAAIEQRKLVLQGIEAARKGRQGQLREMDAELAAIEQEVLALVRVLGTLKKNEAQWAARSLGNLMQTLQGDDKVALLRALAIYADDVRRFQIDAAVHHLRAQAAQHDEALARSRFAAEQWDNLITTAATVLADYHASGIRKSDIAEFFKALGLVVIGVGVAQ